MTLILKSWGLGETLKVPRLEVLRSFEEVLGLSVQVGKVLKFVLIGFDLSYNFKNCLIKEKVEKEVSGWRKKK